MPKPLTVYIASSWKNQAAVEMMTDLLRAKGHDVLSFVENCHGEQRAHEAVDKGKVVPFDEWVWSDRGKLSFEYDTGGATTADLVIYIGPSGCDAWAEVGAAWAKKRPILGLWAKGEDAGLMRRMMTGWTNDYRQILDWVSEAAS